MSRPVLLGRLAKCALIISKFEIVFVSHKAIKGQAFADFLTDHPISAEWEIFEHLPDEKLSWLIFHHHR